MINLYLKYKLNRKINLMVGRIKVNNVLRIVTECLLFIRTDNLFILSGIQPTEFRRLKAALSLAHCAQEPEHLLYERFLSPLGGKLREHKSRHPFVPAVLELLNDPVRLGTSVARWAEYKWSM